MVPVVKAVIAFLQTPSAMHVVNWQRRIFFWHTFHIICCHGGDIWRIGNPKIFLVIHQQWWLGNFSFLPSLSLGSCPRHVRAVPVDVHFFITALTVEMGNFRQVAIFITILSVLPCLAYVFNYLSHVGEWLRAFGLFTALFNQEVMDYSLKVHMHSNQLTNVQFKWESCFIYFVFTIISRGANNRGTCDSVENNYSLMRDLFFCEQIDVNLRLEFSFFLVWGEAAPPGGFFTHLQGCGWPCMNKCVHVCI